MLATKINTYAHEHTQHEPLLLQYIIQETQTNLPTGANMITGRIEGRLLKMLVNLTQAKKVLELGTFTGYSALSMAEALPNDGKLITCEINPQTAAIANKYFQLSPHGHKIILKVGPALDTIASLGNIANINNNLDLVFIDADKRNLDNYFEAVLPKVKSGGLIIIDNTLWKGEVLAANTSHDDKAIIIDNLNKKLVADPRVETVLLYIRDGVSLVRKC